MRDIDVSELQRLHQERGAQDPAVEAALVQIANEVLFAAHRKILLSSLVLPPHASTSLAQAGAVQAEAAAEAVVEKQEETEAVVHDMLRRLSAIAAHHGTTQVNNIIDFAVHKTHAAAFNKEGNHPLAIKCLIPAVSRCPKVDDAFLGGLSEALVLLTDCYSALGRYIEISAYCSAPSPRTFLHAPLPPCISRPPCPFPG